MNQWFRTWHGAPTDPKWRTVAKRAGVRPGDVWAVVSCLHDRASQSHERGSIDGYDAEVIADGLGFGTEEVEAIIAALSDKSVIVDGRIAAWDKYQPKREDGSAERAKAWREGKKNASSENRTQPNATERNRTPDTDTDKIIADPIARTRDDLNRIEAACREAAGCGKDTNPSPELCNLAPVLGLIDGGADLEGEILPALRLKPNPQARGWKYFIPQIQQFRADRLAAASAGLPNARDGPPRRPTFAEINRVASEALRERDYPAPEPQHANLVVLAGPRQGVG